MKNAFLFFLLFPSFAIAQYTYIGRIDDDCSPNYNYNYTYSNYNISSHGYGYDVYRDGILVKSSSGQFGCCAVEVIKVFTDSIVLLVINNAGISQCYRTIDAGNSWSFFNGWADIQLQDISILNKNTAFALSRGVYFDNKRISIKRISDISSRYLIQDDTINTTISDIYLNDTIFGNSYCTNIDTIGYHIKKNGIDINYHIIFVQIPLNINRYSDANPITIYPNPTNNIFNITTSEPYKVILTNGIGQFLKEIRLKKGENEINLIDYSNGIYFLRIYDAQNYITTKKVLKQ